MWLAQAIPFMIWGGLILIALLSWFVWDKRYGKAKEEAIPAGYQRTEEVFYDPTEGKRIRVYYNPETGQRLYRNE